MRKVVVWMMMLMLMLTMASCGEKKTELEKERDEIAKLVEEHNAQTTEQGKWLGDHFVMSIDGESVLVDDYNDYVGTIDTQAKTITLKKAASGDKDVTFDYQIISGQLVMTTEAEDNRLGYHDTYSLNRAYPPALQQRIDEYNQKYEAEQSKIEEETTEEEEKE